MDLELSALDGTSAATFGSPAALLLPAQLKVLYVTTADRTGALLAATLAADSATKVTLIEVQGPADGLEQLGSQAFDVVLVVHSPPEMDSLSLVEGLRAGGMQEPTLIVGSGDRASMAPLAYEVGADGYICEKETTTREFLWTIARATERHRLIQENRRRGQQQRLRGQQDCAEAGRLLSQQRSILAAAETASMAEIRLPPLAVKRYEQLLRTHVVMGSGNLAGEIESLVQMLCDAAAEPRDLLLLHTGAVEQQIRGLGGKGSRHLLARADLLLLEILARLSHAYRAKYLESAGATG
jgi:DNA-binding NarL/FixJ family response regulator